MSAVQYGPSGPTELRDVTPPEGMSNEMAAFIAANGSPFTNPRDMPVKAKVPDARNTQDTETAFIYGKCQLRSHVDENGLYSLVVMTSADPFAPLPLAWSTFDDVNITPAVGTITVNTNTTTSTNYPFNGYESPCTWAQKYDVAGLEDMVAQQRTIAMRAKSYRVVGHGLKVWVANNTDNSNGNIEAGQVDVDAMPHIAVNQNRFTRFAQGQYTNGVLRTIDVLPPTNIRWDGSPNGPDYGYQGTLLMQSDSKTYRRLIQAGKTPDFGFLSAEEGATVRWTDTNDFKFQKCVDRGYIFPSKKFIRSTDMNTHYERARVESTGLAGSKVSQYWPAHSKMIGSTTSQFGWAGTSGFTEVSENLLTISETSMTNTQDYDKPLLLGNGLPGTMAASPAEITYPALDSSQSIIYRQRYSDTIASTDWKSYNTSEQQFGKALYADISGLSIGGAQVITVQVVWHIEYVPRGLDAFQAEQSPVDASFETHAQMLRDHRAYPIIVKGHSFFSSLKSAFRKASHAIGKIFAAAAPIASSLLSSMPDPRIKALGAGIGGLDMAIKRQKLAAAYDVD